MGVLAKLTKSGQVSLPKEIREKTNMQAGDFVDVEIDKKGHIILTPKKLVDSSQAYFWTEEWQKGERQADDDLKTGRFKDFDSIEEAIEYLKSRG